MNFNWIDAATPQGRERLEELADSGKNVVAKLNGHEGILYNVLANMPNTFKRPKWYSFIQRLGNISKPIEWYIENGIEFLDPDQPNEIAAIKAENERMRNALLEIEADARAKLAANLPLNSNETLHSVKHGLGQMFVNSKSGDIGAAIDAIARTFKKPEPELKPLEWRFYNLSNSYVSQHCPLTNQFIAQKANNGVWGLNACCNDTDTTFPTFEALAAHVEALRHEALKKLLK